MAKKLFARVFGKGDAKDEKEDFRIKAKQELASQFKGRLTPSKMQSIVDAVYAKYQAVGLRGVVAKPMREQLGQYETTLIASTVKVSTADAVFELLVSDLDLGWGRTVAMGVLRAGSKTHPFDRQQNDGTHHAEEKLIMEMDKQWAEVAQPKSTGITNTLILSITRSPCGEMPEAPNCAKKIREFAARCKRNYTLDLEVRAASIYYGKFRKSSREAIQQLVKSGIKLTAWDLIAEMGDKTEVDKATVAKLQKRIDSASENLPIIIKAGAGG
jgi:hypothetical protein